MVVWLNTTGDVLNDTQQAAFEGFIQSGGGYVGVHSATDTEYDWPWYGQLIGNNAWFQNHPFIQEAHLDVEIGDHPSTQHLGSGEFTEEWYNFRENPRPVVDVLVTLDETTYSGGTMGDHPISWCHEFQGGRSWYTGMGHRTQTFQSVGFQQHLLGGILWASAAGATPVPAFSTIALGVLTVAVAAIGLLMLRNVDKGLARTPAREQTLE